jgi:hypothetical protein
MYKDVEIMEITITNAETNTDALGLLQNLACNEINSLSMYKNDKIIGLAKKHAEKGSTTGLGLLWNLAVPSENKLAILQNPEIMKICKVQAEKGVHNAFGLLRSLTYHKENKLFIYQDIEIMKIVLNHADKNGNTIAMDILWNLSTLDAIGTDMFKNDEIMRIAKKYAENGNDTAIGLLRGIAYTNKVLAYQDKEFVRIIKLYANRGNENALGALATMSVQFNNRESMYEDQEIIMAAKKFAKEKGIISAYNIIISLADSPSIAEGMSKDHVDILKLGVKSLAPPKKFAFQGLMILHYLSNAPLAVKVLDVPSIIKSVSKYLNRQDNNNNTSEDEANLQLRAAMILANIVGTDKDRAIKEPELLTTNPVIIKYLLELLNHILTQPPEKEFAGEVLWRLTVPLQPIRSLCLVEENHPILISHGLLPLLTLSLSMAISNKDWECVLYSLQTLHQLILPIHSMSTTVVILKQDLQLVQVINDLSVMVETAHNDNLICIQSLAEILKGKICC